MTKTDRLRNGMRPRLLTLLVILCGFGAARAQDAEEIRSLLVSGMEANLQALENVQFTGREDTMEFTRPRRSSQEPLEEGDQVPSFRLIKGTSLEGMGRFEMYPKDDVGMLRPQNLWVWDGTYYLDSSRSKPLPEGATRWTHGNVGLATLSMPEGRPFVTVFQQTFAGIDSKRRVLQALKSANSRIDPVPKEFGGVEVYEVTLVPEEYPQNTLTYLIAPNHGCIVLHRMLWYKDLLANETTLSDIIQLDNGAWIAKVRENVSFPNTEHAESLRTDLLTIDTNPLIENPDEYFSTDPNRLDKGFMVDDRVNNVEYYVGETPVDPEERKATQLAEEMMAFTDDVVGIEEVPEVPEGDAGAPVTTAAQESAPTADAPAETGEPAPAASGAAGRADSRRAAGYIVAVAAAVVAAAVLFLSLRKRRR